MPLVLGCFALGFPRLVLFVVWLFGGGYIGRAFSDGLFAVLGFLFLPLTTLAYVYSMNSLGAPGEVSDLGWILIVIAGLLDLGLIGGSSRARRR